MRTAYSRAMQKDENGRADVQSISKYATKNEREFFAECLAARERGEKIPDYAEKMLDTVIGIAQNRVQKRLEEQKKQQDQKK